MTNINGGRVVLGGLLAGLIINISETILNIPVLGEQMDAVMKTRNLPAVGGAAIAVFTAGGFVLGVLLVWLYAAIRPRFGAGAKTAMLAGLVLWLLAYVWPALGVGLMGIMPGKLLTVTTIWGLAEVILASIAGGWLYKEGPLEGT